MAVVKISVIVPAFNEEKLIQRSLQSIKAASVGFVELGWETELIVCDNNSSDLTADLAIAEGARVVSEPINQIARARNAGAAAASGDWMVFVDADSYPSHELFQDVAREIRGGCCLAGGCTVRVDENHFLANLLTRGWNSLSRMVKWAAGSFIFCESTAFREVGGFSNELFAGEEIELSRRLKRLARTRGKKMVILHRHPLMTSARKIHLYSKREHLSFLLRVFRDPARTVKSRAACTPWYDGRR
ncbi:MAG: glycosyltransferase [Pedosphaera sp.]|nr:glycosyltransferase [Pedosphaera sp.]